MGNSTDVQKFYGRTGLTRLIVTCMVLIAPVLTMLVDRYIPEKGFADLNLFGEVFKDSWLPEVRLLDPPVDTPYGNDGQFYVQLALNPALTRADELRIALDVPAYRARRIGMPVLAFIFGAGQPPLVIQVYSLLNVAFWLALLIVLLRRTKPGSWKDFLLCAALLWSFGSLTSISRGLTDLPAIVLVLFAVLSERQWVATALLFSYSVLVKETSIVSSFALLWPLPRFGQPWRRFILTGLTIVLPFLIWVWYVQYTFPGETQTGYGNFSIPLAAFIDRVQLSYDAFVESLAAPSPWPAYRAFRFLELVSLISLLVQAVYMILKPRLDSAYWRMGIGFALLLFFLGGSVWNDVYAYTRALLPLTFAFNLVIYNYETGYEYFPLYIFGNAGLVWGLLEIYVV